ncbi:hypothetical protein D9758_001998 [Tetrapyrgos nigripes]|uniref:Uncharacterized protein n=1 Tax=Tetrapyrgos nigripes TaxID=182062 RepID=A0A8H5GTF0_9AGAR|nr:hypothetical protein D9758_001998 [Tetrapyrgos nigripes]
MKYSTPSSSSLPTVSSSSSPTLPTSLVPSTPINPEGSSKRRFNVGNRGSPGVAPARRAMTSALINAKLSLNSLDSHSTNFGLRLGRDSRETHLYCQQPGYGTRPEPVVVQLHDQIEEDREESCEAYAQAFPIHSRRTVSTGLLTPTQTTPTQTQTPSSTQKSSSSNPFSKLRRSVSAAVRAPNLSLSAQASAIRPSNSAGPHPSLLPSPTSPLSRPDWQYASQPREQSQYPYRSQNDKPKSYHRPEKHESRCMQRIRVDLYIAFEDDSVSFGVSSSPPKLSLNPLSRTRSSRNRSDIDLEELRTSNGQRFTHIVRVSAMKLVPGESVQPPEVRYTTLTGDKDHKTKCLTLTAHPYIHSSYEYRMNLLAMEPELETLPPLGAVSGSRGNFIYPALDGLTPEQARMYYEASMREMDDSDDGVTRLTMQQLCAARDWLASTGYDVQSPNGGGPRILITAPRDHRTDVVSILVCFLAYVSNNPVMELLSKIDRQKEFLRVWRGALSREGSQVVQQVVRLGSGFV